MPNYPEKRSERCRIGIDQADTEQIEMKRAWNVTCSKGLGRTEIEDYEALGTGR